MKNFHTPLEIILHMHIHLNTKFGGNTITVRPKNTFKPQKNGSQNFAFLVTWVHFVLLWPNALNHLHKILHTSSQVLRESPSQISASKSNFKYDFLAIFSFKRTKICKFTAFFCYKTLNFWATCLKFCM